MNFSGALPRLFMMLVAFAIGAMLFRTGVSEGLKTVIASEPPPAKVEQAPSFTGWAGCGLDEAGRFENPLRCRMEMRAAQSTPTIAPAPVQMMTRHESEKASGWFLLAGLAFPIALGGAALLMLTSYFGPGREDPESEEV